MKQITIRLNDTGVKMLSDLKTFFEEKKSQPVFEKILLTWRGMNDRIYLQDKRIAELEAIVKYLEEK
jgi:hypothetical protein